MAHLLMIESWVGASGNLLPPLIREMGHEYTFVTRKPAHYQSAMGAEQHAVFRYASNVIETETNDVDALVEALRPHCFDGVITVCDYYIETVIQVAKALGLPCPFPASVRTARQKHLMRQALDAAGLANPKYCLAQNWVEVEQAAQEIGYPLVLKPVDLASSAFVRLIRNGDDLASAYKDLEGFPNNFRDQPRDCTYLLEAYMIGEEVSVESVSRGGRINVLGITDKSITGEPYFIEDGHMFPAAMDETVSEEVKAFVRNALQAVGYDHGIAHTEVKLTEDGPRIVEINPRTAGNYIVELIERVTGINLLRTFVELALNAAPSLEPVAREAKSAAIRFIVPPRGGMIREIRGVETLENDPHVTRYKVEDCAGKHIDQPIDNACYLGHIVAQDVGGTGARAYADAALNRLEVCFEQGEEPR